MGWTSEGGRGVTRLDGARARNKFGAPVFEPELFRKQIHCTEESICDIFWTFRRPGNFAPLAHRRIQGGLRGLKSP